VRLLRVNSERSSDAQSSCFQNNSIEQGILYLSIDSLFLEKGHVQRLGPGLGGDKRSSILGTGRKKREFKPRPMYFRLMPIKRFQCLKKKKRNNKQHDT